MSSFESPGDAGASLLDLNVDSCGSLFSLFDDQMKDESFSVGFFSFDMWGSCHSRNVKQVIRKSRCLKPLRIRLLELVLQLCRSAGLEPFVYGGTALSVYREHGRMIEHDSDIDLGILEYCDNTEEGMFSRLLSKCIEVGVAFSGVDNSQHMVIPESDSPLCVSFSSGISQKTWLRFSNTDPVSIIEEPYGGVDCKRAKFFYTQTGLDQACCELKKKRRTFQSVLSDPSLVHVDLFTLSRHACDAHSLRVNWNIPGAYDSINKGFPKKSIFPLRPCNFEGIPLLSPAQLQTYLGIEYGYLGRDAVYDSKKQEYVKMPTAHPPTLPHAKKPSPSSHH